MYRGQITDDVTSCLAKTYMYYGTEVVVNQLYMIGNTCSSNHYLECNSVAFHDCAKQQQIY